MREFTVPKVATRHQLGKVDFDYAFEIAVTCDAPHDLRTPRGGRVYRSTTGGSVKAPGLAGRSIRTAAVTTASCVRTTWKT
jgi:hypothetical protein